MESSLRMVRVGNRIVNLSLITLAEYTPAFVPPADTPSAKATRDHHPITYTRPEPRPAQLIVHFLGGEQHQFFGEHADELNSHFDLLV